MATEFVGLPMIRGHIDLIAAAAERNGGPVPIKHLLLHMDEGYGRTTLLRYMSEVFMRSGAWDFKNIDPFLEERIPDDFEAMKHMIAHLQSCAVYTNKYTGIIGLDVSNLGRHMNDAKFVSCVRDLVSDLAETSLFVFFLPSRPGLQDRQIRELLTQACDQFLDNIPAEEYSPEAIARILQILLEQRHLELCPLELQTYASQAMKDNQPPQTPAESKRIVKLIQHLALYSDPEMIRQRA